MRFLSIPALLLLVCCLFANATAGPVADRVKASALVHCGGVARPGLAFPDTHGRWQGLEVDLCRAVAVAVSGARGRAVFHGYKTDKDFDAVRNGGDDIYFLTGTEIARHKLAGLVVPGPAVFFETRNLMVAAKFSAHHVGALAADSICYKIGSPVEQDLNAYFARLGKHFLNRAFSEDGEMIDAYKTRNCHALAAEITRLAAIRQGGAQTRTADRILPETLSAFPVIAATTTSDGNWSAIVAWTVDTLISAERTPTLWTNSGPAAMPVFAPELGLDKKWQDRVLKAVGNYGEILARNVGRNSPLKLPPGLNANQVKGGLLLGPFCQ